MLLETEIRLYEKLRQNLQANVLQLLEDKDVNEIMVNPDGKLWIDRCTQGLMHFGHMDLAKITSIINSIAGINDLIVNHRNPKLETRLPVYNGMRGERFTAQVPPIVASPSFTIRKHSEIIFTLNDYIDSARLEVNQADQVRNLIRSRKNILICGGPGSGKTTFTNALIHEAISFDPMQRFIILEDLPELQCKAFNKVSMLTTDNVKMTDLVRSAMRMRPDRILIGEVRGGEALDMLKAWNTGCPGGICTIHANGSEEALQRLIDLSMEAGLLIQPINLILHTIDAVVSIERQHNKKGFVREIKLLQDYKNGKFEFKKFT